MKMSPCERTITGSSDILVWIVAVFRAVQLAAAPQEVGVWQDVNQRDRSVGSISSENPVVRFQSNF